MGLVQPGEVAVLRRLNSSFLVSMRRNVTKRENKGPEKRRLGQQHLQRSLCHLFPQKTLTFKLPLSMYPQGWLQVNRSNITAAAEERRNEIRVLKFSCKVQLKREVKERYKFRFTHGPVQHVPALAFRDLRRGFENTSAM
ncbi:hypothetical protein QYF61_027392 [Mycteria americana]|uniref:Uncharacterized protein n=1 Tax=Mycteria americana TaxID=33587 RepID=A0AAN7NN57_MYCAM|nr:hypothetical protein QYF61_027392 [Mycteria americana]